MEKIRKHYVITKDNHSKIQELKEKTNTSSSIIVNEILKDFFSNKKTLKQIGFRL